MGWSTQIVVVKNSGDELFWNDFYDKSIKIIEWNKTYLAQYMSEVVNNFPEESYGFRYKTDKLEEDDGDGYHYCGWDCRELTKEVLEELSKPDSIERFANIYQEHSWGFKTKKERKDFIKKWKNALKVCRYFVGQFWTKIYWIEG